MSFDEVPPVAYEGDGAAMSGIEPVPTKLSIPNWPEPVCSAVTVRFLGTYRIVGQSWCPRRWQHDGIRNLQESDARRRPGPSGEGDGGNGIRIDEAAGGELRPGKVTVWP